MFVHLHGHSHYSFLRGVAPPEEIIAAAVAQKMPAVALTDTNGLYAAVPFYQAAKAAGIKPIVGVAIDAEFRVSQFADRNSKFEIRNLQSSPMVLLAEDMEGYSNLCALVTLRHLGTTELEKSKSSGSGSRFSSGSHSGSNSDSRSGSNSHSNSGFDSGSDFDPGKDEGRPVTLEDLAAHSRGVIALCPLPTSMYDAGDRRGTNYRAPTKAGPRIANRQGQEFSDTRHESQITNHESPVTNHQSPVTSHQSPLTSHFARLKEIFGNRLWIEVQHLSPGDGRMLREAERIGRELGVPLVVTNSVYFLRPEEHLHHRAVNAIRTGGLLTTVAAPDITTGEAWFKPAAEMQKLFPDHPELLRATLRNRGALQPGAHAKQNYLSGIPGARRRVRVFLFVEAVLCGRAETLPPAAPRSALPADARIGRDRKVTSCAVFFAGVGHRGRGQAARNSRGGARVGGQLDGDVLPRHFLRVPAALGIVF